MQETEEAQEQDAVFAAEQAHLSEAYGKLQAIRREAEQRLSAMSAESGEEFAAMKDELFLGSADEDQVFEMQVEYELINTMIDQFNLSYDVNVERLRRALMLLRKPYFAKVSLQFKPGEPPRDLYIGDAGMVDENRRHFILDWRSPVAEVYYNQENGPTSYEANGRTIHCDLKLRRQFDIAGPKLNSYFDTTVAIEDNLLVEALMKQRSDKMTAITSTIQREQNQVIRHPDVPVLMVNGIAGSGKTSVLLQRIAYLFYHNREDLDPSQVYLITPNPVFRTYIDGVLPELGEANPQLLTYEELIARVGRLDRGRDGRASLDDMLRLRDLAESYEFTEADFCDIKVGSEVVVNANQVRAAFHKHRNMPSKRGMVELVVEDLLDQLESRIKSRANSEAAQGELVDLPAEEQRRIFGHEVFPQTEEDFRELTGRYLEDRYAGMAARIEAAEWLRIDRIGTHLMGASGLTRAEWAFLKVCLTGICARDVRYVMIDEVQDYTEAQLALMCAYFPHAHFLLLGDENQAIAEGTAGFSQVRRVFGELCGSLADAGGGAAAARGGSATIEECRLMTSYRSTPEITALFSSLMDKGAQIEVHSVQRPGNEPVVRACGSHAEYVEALAAALGVAAPAADAGAALKPAPAADAGAALKPAPAADAEASQGPVSAGETAPAGLTAVIVAQERGVRPVMRTLAELGVQAMPMDGKQPMPKEGVAVFTVKTAKGLEFDRVIVADATAENYSDTPVSRHRLYTAISRATQQVWVLSPGPCSPLLPV